MKTVVRATLIGAVIGLSTAQLQAADVSITVTSKATPAWQWVGHYYGGSYSQACPYGYFYACRYDRFLGNRGSCDCWPYSPYWLFHS